MDEVKADGNVILFIDEVHNLVGTGDAEGSMNAANILKPALSRGEIQVIGATTFNEYRKYIEKDAALERRFQPVTVAEPSIGDAVEILLGIKSYYEEYHRVRVSPEICRRMVVLASGTSTTVTCPTRPLTCWTRLVPAPPCGQAPGGIRREGAGPHPGAKPGAGPAGSRRRRPGGL